MSSRERGVNLESVFSGHHNRQKVTDWAYKELKEAIVNLRLPPESPLREAAIAERLGVSKTPVREAIARLEQDGLVVTTSFKGAVVSSYSRRDLTEIYELRELLECTAARSAAESISDSDLDRLRGAVAESRKLRDANRLGELAELLGQFEEVIFGEVTNGRIRSLIDNLRAHLTRIGQLTTEIPGRIAASVEEHARIVDAIANRNPDAAERAMRDHIRSVLTDQLEAGVEEKEATTASPQA